MKLAVCDTKTLYDTEFEATIAAAKKSFQFGQEMAAYPCNPSHLRHPHYHLTHVRKNERRGAGSRYIKCESCGLFVRRWKYEHDKHICPKEKTPEGVLS